MISKVIAFLVVLNITILLPLSMLYFYAFYYVSVSDIYITPMMILHKIPVVGVDAFKYMVLNLSVGEEDPYVPTWLNCIQYEYMLKFITSFILVLVNITIVSDNPNKQYVGKPQVMWTWANLYVWVTNSTLNSLYKVLLILQLRKVSVVLLQLISLWLVASFISSKKDYKYYSLPYLLSSIVQIALYEHKTKTIIPLIFYLSPLIYAIAFSFLHLSYHESQIAILTLYFTLGYGVSLPDFNFQPPIIIWVGAIISLIQVLLVKHVKNKKKIESRVSEGLRAARAIERLITDIEEALH